MHNVLVTGGCGFIGANLIPHLLATGRYRIVVLDNESLGKRSYLDGYNVNFIHADIRDRPAIERVLDDIDVVIHLAADTRVIDSIENPATNFEVNVIGTFNLLTAMREAGIDRLINASTGGAILGDVPPPVHEDMIPNPASPYGASKLAVEGYCSAFAGAYDMKITSLRFSNVYGPRSYHKGSVVAAFYKRILASEELVVFGDGTQVRDYIFVEDLCDGIRRAVESEVVGVFQLGTGRGTTVNELIEAMRRAVGETHKVEVRYEDFRPGEIYATYCDISKAQRSLAFDPRTPLHQGLKRTWDWFIENGALFQS